jgi:hypothetical protein
MSAPVHLRKYGEQAVINFELFEVDGVDLRIDASHAAGDTKLMKDEGAEANTTNGFVDEGQGYSITLTATELQAARLALYVVDSATKVWLDRVIYIETYGHPSAQHAMDFDQPGLGMIATTIATLASQTEFTLTAGSTDDDAYNDCIIVVRDATTAVQKAVGFIQNYAGGTKTITLENDPGIFTMAVGDIVEIIADRTKAAITSYDPPTKTEMDDLLRGLIMQQTTIAGLTSQTQFTLAAGSTDDGAYEYCVIVVTDQTTGTQKAHGAIKTYTGGTKEVILNRDPGVFTMAVGDKVDILSTATAQAIWDTILTGTTFNISQSAGRRLRGIQEFQGYENGAVWVDTLNGTSGAVSYENGTVENPVDNFTDAMTILGNLNLTRMELAPGSTITLDQAYSGLVMRGTNWTLALGNQDCGGSTFIGADVSGTCTGTDLVHFIGCAMGTCTLPECHLHACGLGVSITASEAGTYIFDQCYSEVAGLGTPIFDFGTAVGNTNLNMRHYSGGIQVESMGDTGTDLMSLEGKGQFVEGTCTSGSPVIRGNFTRSGITNLTPSDDARIDKGQIDTAVWESIMEVQGSYTAQQIMSVLLAALAGVTTNGGLTLKTPDGAATRLVLTIDAPNRERDSATLTPSTS